MHDIDIWKVFASFGIPGLALGVYYMLFRQFKWDFPRVPRSWVGPIIVLFMLLTAAIVYRALMLPSTPAKHTNQNKPRIDRELASSVILAIHELDADSRYLYDLKKFLIGELAHMPMGRLESTETLHFLTRYFDKVAPFTYGEEDVIIPHVKEIEIVTERLRNIKSRKDVKKFEEESEFTIDDLRFLVGFLRWYISGIGKKIIPASFSSSFKQSGSSLYVDYKPLFMKYFIEEDGTPITNFSDYLSLID